MGYFLKPKRLPLDLERSTKRSESKPQLLTNGKTLACCPLCSLIFFKKNSRSSAYTFPSSWKCRTSHWKINYYELERTSGFDSELQTRIMGRLARWNI